VHIVKFIVFILSVKCNGFIPIKNLDCNLGKVHSDVFDVCAFFLLCKFQGSLLLPF
jgi:hypothetical protein